MADDLMGDLINKSELRLRDRWDIQGIIDDSKAR